MAPPPNERFRPAALTLARRPDGCRLEADVLEAVDDLGGAGHAVPLAEDGLDPPAHVLVTGIQLPNQYVDNVLANSQGPITGEKFERFETAFVGAGDTLSAALAALLSVGAELHSAVSEALSFLDQSLDAGFRPGMGNVIPDRFFWALPAGEEEGGEPTDFEPDPEPEQPPKTPRRMH